MRQETDKDRLIAFMSQLGEKVGSSGRVYFTGGACSVWFGWREMTVDIDIKADPEPMGFFEGIAEMKEVMQLNIELASPDQFIPELPGWRERSLFIQKSGKIDFFHYDFYSQALSKLERCHARDVLDARSMRSDHLIEPQKLRRLFSEIEPKLIRYPAIESKSFKKRVMDFCESSDIKD